MRIWSERWHSSRTSTSKPKKRRSKLRFSWRIKSKFSNTSSLTLAVPDKIKPPTEPCLMKTHSMNSCSCARAILMKLHQNLTIWFIMSRQKIPWEKRSSIREEKWTSSDRNTRDKCTIQARSKGRRWIILSRGSIWIRKSLQPGIKTSRVHTSKRYKTWKGSCKRIKHKERRLKVPSDKSRRSRLLIRKRLLISIFSSKRNRSCSKEFSTWRAKLTICAISFMPTSLINDYIFKFVNLESGSIF